MPAGKTKRLRLSCLPRKMYQFSLSRPCIHFEMLTSHSIRSGPRGWIILKLHVCRYIRLSLSRLRLSRITAYLEMKFWSLFKHENLLTGNKILLWKREGAIPPFFPQYFQYISNFRSQIIYSFVKCGCLINFYLNSANLTCRGTDISKYFRGPWTSR